MLAVGRTVIPGTLQALIPILPLLLSAPAAAQTAGVAPGVAPPGGSAGASADTAAEEETRTSFPFAPPLASPLEPRTRLAPVRVGRGPRDRWVGLVDLGENLPFWIRKPVAGEGGAPEEGLALAGAIAGGAFSRFDLEENSNEFIEVHFHVGLRLKAAWRALEARAEVFHTSSHLGDEFLERTGRDPISTSREGLELLLGGRPLEGLRIYGGPGVLLRSTEDLDSGSFRGGAEWDGSGLRWGPFTPYAAGELFSWAELDWDPRMAGEAGVAFGSGRFRLAAIVGAGPSRAEQFLREDETLWGFSFTASP